MVPSVRGEVLDEGDPQIVGGGMEIGSNIPLAEPAHELLSEMLQLPIIAAEKDPFIPRDFPTRGWDGEITRGCAIVKDLDPCHGFHAPGRLAASAAM